MERSILDGTDGLIDRWLGLDSKGWKYKQRRSLLLLIKQPPEVLDGVELISGLVSRIRENWRDFRSKGFYPSSERSKANWRYEKQRYISPRNRSPEKTLEKSISIITGDDWVNQVPTCAGLVGSGEKSRNIDLIHRHLDQGIYSFIELKVDSDQPIFAAMEILKYGLIYVFWREHLQELSELGFPTADRELLKARHVSLEVLAPSPYYQDGSLEWLASAIDKGLSGFLGKRADLGFTMSFQFQAFPPGFSWSPWSSHLADALQARYRIE